jgi:hypothetical protein
MRRHTIPISPRDIVYRGAQSPAIPVALAGRLGGYGTGENVRNNGDRVAPVTLPPASSVRVARGA